MSTPLAGSAGGPSRTNTTHSNKSGGSNRSDGVYVPVPERAL